MSTTDNRFGWRLRTGLAGLLVAGGAVVAHGAMAEPLDLADLAKHPQKALGVTVELVGFCVNGGRSGDVLGYECTSDAGVYVDTDDIEPEAVKEKLADCGVSKSEECRVTVAFEPHSYTTSGVIEPGKSIVVFNSKTAKVSF